MNFLSAFFSFIIGIYGIAHVGASTFLGQTGALWLAQGSVRLADNASTTPSDTTPPVISGVWTTNVTDSGGTVKWTTDEPATSLVDFGELDNPYVNTATGDGGALVTSHSVNLSQSNMTGGYTFKAGTKYYFRMRSKDAAENSAMSQSSNLGYYFTTLGTSPSTSSSTDTQPPSISNVVVTPHTDYAGISWSTNELTTGKFEWGRTDFSLGSYPYGASDSYTPATSHSLESRHTLEAGTTYYYKLTATDAAGNVSTYLGSFTIQMANTFQPGTPICFLVDSTRTWGNIISNPKPTDPDVGTGYAFMTKSGQYTVDSMKTACTEADFSALTVKYCAQNTNSFQKWVQLVQNSPGSGNTLTMASFSTFSCPSSSSAPPPPPVPTTSTTCSTDANCSVGPGAGATFCDTTGKLLQQYQRINICSSGSCVGTTRSQLGTVQNCGASGQVCGFTQDGGGTFKCVVPPATQCAINSSITSACMCGNVSYSNYGYCCAGPQHSVFACVTTAPPPPPAPTTSTPPSLPPPSGVNDTTLPSVPVGLTATPKSYYSIEVRWSGSINSVVKGFHVYRNDVLVPVSQRTDQNEQYAYFHDNYLSSGNTYTYTVEAYDAAGNVSPKSAPVSATTPVSNNDQSSQGVAVCSPTAHWCAGAGGDGYCSTGTAYCPSQTNLISRTDCTLQGRVWCTPSSIQVAWCAPYGTSCTGTTVAVPPPLLSPLITSTPLIFMPITTTPILPSPFLEVMCADGSRVPSGAHCPVLVVFVCANGQKVQNSSDCTPSTPPEDAITLCVHMGGTWCSDRCVPRGSICSVVTGTGVMQVIDPAQAKDFQNQKRELLREIRLAERAFRKTEQKPDVAEASLLKDKLEELKLDGPKDAFQELVSLRQASESLNEKAEEARGRRLQNPAAVEADTRTQEDNLRKIKQQIRPFERQLATLEKQVKVFEKVGIVVDPALKQAITEVKSVAQKIKVAKNYDAADEAVEDMLDAGMALNDFLPYVESASRLSKAVKLLDGQVLAADRALQQTLKLTKRLKIDSSEDIGEMRVLFEQAKAAVAAIKTGGIGEEALFEYSQTHVLDAVNEILEIADHFGVITNVRRHIAKVTSDLKRYDTRIRQQERKKKDMTDAHALVNEARGNLAGLQKLVAQRLTVDTAEAMLGFMRSITDTNEQLDEILGVAKPSAVDRDLEQIIESGGGAVKPLDTEAVEKLIL